MYRLTTRSLRAVAKSDLLLKNVNTQVKIEQAKNRIFLTDNEILHGKLQMQNLSLENEELREKCRDIEKINNEAIKILREHEMKISNLMQTGKLFNISSEVKTNDESKKSEPEKCTFSEWVMVTGTGICAGLVAIWTFEFLMNVVK